MLLLHFRGEFYKVNSINSHGAYSEIYLYIAGTTCGDKVDWQVNIDRKMTLFLILCLLLYMVTLTHGSHVPCPDSCDCHKVLHQGHLLSRVRIRCTGSAIPDLSPLMQDASLKELTLDTYKNGNSIDIRKKDFTPGLKIKSLVVKGGSKTGLHDGAFQNLDDCLVSLRVGNGLVFNSSLSFLRGLSNLKRLELENNKQYWTRRNDSHVVSLFSDLGLKMLRHLDMSYCFIYRMSGDVFLGIENIASLDLSGNRLSEIPSAFSRLTDLQYLDLSFNNIYSLQSGPFTKLKRLKTLRLAGNEFGELNFDTFSGLENSLVSLDLQMTKQKVLPTHALSKLSALKILNINENPFKLMPAYSLKGDYCLDRLDMHYTEVIFHPNMFYGQTGCIRILSLYKPKLNYIPRKAISTLSRLEVLEFQGVDIKVLETNALSGIQAKTLDLSFLPLAHIEEGAFNNLSVPVRVHLTGTFLTSLDFALDYPSGTFQRLEVDSEGSLLCNCDIVQPMKLLGCALNGTCSRTDNSNTMYLGDNKLRDYLTECSDELLPLTCSSDTLVYCCSYSINVFVVTVMVMCY